MDLLPIFVLILFVILGGFIAVVADNVGRKLGKRKHRLGNLRPRHTAMLGTFVVGVVISIFTIALITIASSDVRQWIAEGRRAIHQRNQAQRELASVREELSMQATRNTELDQDIQEKTREVQEQAGRLKAMNAQIAKLQPQIATLQSRVSAANQRIASLNRERERAQRELQLRQERLKAAQSRLASVQRELVAAQRERERQEALARVAADQKKETDQQNLKLTRENEQLEKNITALQAEIDRLTREAQTLQAARAKAQQDLDEAEQRLTESQAELAQTQRDIQLLQQQVATLRTAAQTFGQIAGQARTEPLIYHMGEEVSRLFVEGGVSVRQAEEALTGLLRSARLAAAARGAQPRGGISEAAIVEGFDPETRLPISPEQQAREVAQRIAGAGGPVVVVASSVVNAFRGEPVPLDIHVFPNPVVYQRGQVIAETRVDGNREEEAILKQLEELISVRIRQRAQADNMVARLGSNEYGEISPVEIYKLLSQVRQADRVVRVQALAVNDTRAGDPLRLEFRIR